MPEAVLIAVLILALFAALAASIVGITALRGRKDDGSAAPALREEFDRSRAEAQATAKDLRGELSESVTRMGQQLSGQVTQIATVQNNQIDAFSRQLVELTTANERRLQELRETVDKKLGEAKEDARLGREESAGTLRRFSESLNQQLAVVQASNDQRLTEMRPGELLGGTALFTMGRCILIQPNHPTALLS